MEDKVDGGDTVEDPEFIHLNLQMVQHRDGWTVGNAGRYAVHYQDREKAVLAAVERGKPTWLYSDSLMLEAEDGAQTPLPPSDVPIVVDRLVRGLAAMGVKTELDTDASTAGQPVRLN